MKKTMKESIKEIIRDLINLYEKAAEERWDMARLRRYEMHEGIVFKIVKDDKLSEHMILSIHSYILDNSKINGRIPNAIDIGIKAMNMNCDPKLFEDIHRERIELLNKYLRND